MRNLSQLSIVMRDFQELLLLVWIAFNHKMDK